MSYQSVSLMMFEGKKNIGILRRNFVAQLYRLNMAMALLLFGCYCILENSIEFYKVYKSKHEFLAGK